MKRFAAFGASAVLLLICFALGGSAVAQVSPLALVPAFRLPIAVVTLVAALAGALGTWGAIGYATNTAERHRIGLAAVLPTVAGAGTVLLLASVPALPAPRAAAALLLGTLAIIAGLRCIELLSAGEPIGFESHWGGLGGGSGGWRLFPASALAILSLSFAGGTLAVLVSEPIATTKSTKQIGTDNGSKGSNSSDSANGIAASNTSAASNDTAPDNGSAAGENVAAGSNASAAQ